MLFSQKGGGGMQIHQNGRKNGEIPPVVGLLVRGRLNIKTVFYSMLAVLQATEVS